MNFIISILKKYTQAGFLDFQKLIIANLIWMFNCLRPSFRKNVIEEQNFDLQYQTDTTKIVKAAHLDVPEEIRKNSVRYEPTRVWLFDQIFNNLSIAYDDYIFIDFGSGRGRVLLFASNFPLKKIIGIETSPSLNLIANENIRKFKNPK